MELYQTERISDRITALRDVTGVCAYLVTGSRSALLLDACTGLGDLAQAAARITALPVQVVLTHGHCDHNGSAARFDAVWMSPRDLALWREHNFTTRLDHVRRFLPDLPPEELTPDPVSPPQPLADWQVFDLGDRTVETIPVPGHTPGMTCALIPEERTILFGDGCCKNTLLLEGGLATVAQFAESLERLKAWEPRFDTVLYSHGPAADASRLPGCLELAYRVLDGRDDRVPAEFLGRKMFRAAAVKESFERVDGGLGNLCYRLEP